mmetsp:Transcript_19705/g.58626  ORF Transcript_19705/g.58626 Transcript_19705/m.58626 type:complete len:276 (+) Transcript_19705:2362-3189(+)
MIRRAALALVGLLIAPSVLAAPRRHTFAALRPRGGTQTLGAARVPDDVFGAARAPRGALRSALAVRGGGEAKALSPERSGLGALLAAAGGAEHISGAPRGALTDHTPPNAGDPSLHRQLFRPGLRRRLRRQGGARGAERRRAQARRARADRGLADHHCGRPQADGGGPRRGGEDGRGALALGRVVEAERGGLLGVVVRALRADEAQVRQDLGPLPGRGLLRGRRRRGQGRLAEAPGLLDADLRVLQGRQGARPLLRGRREQAGDAHRAVPVRRGS